MWTFHLLAILFLNIWSIGGFVLPPTATTPISVASKEQRASETRLFMFGKLFGGNNGGSKKLDENGEAKVFESSPEDINLEFEGLSDYIQKWGKLFVDGSIKLTTPAQVSTIDGDNSVGSRFLFQSTDTGYKNRREEDEQKSNDDSSKKKKKAVSQGGLDVLVERGDDGKVRVIARRCEIEEGTIIKEMSEEIILSELNQAISAWKKGSTTS